MLYFTREVREFLRETQSEYSADLIEAYLAAVTPETQINIRNDVGTPRTFDGKPLKSRTLDGFNFWPIRYPKNADSNPGWGDAPELQLALSKFAEAVGSTWLSPTGSVRFGFDVDTIAGHPDCGLTPAQLQEAFTLASKVDFLEIRRSTGGEGYHLYAIAEGITVANHTEHASVGRAVLGLITERTGISFNKNVDVCGSNMWLYHRKASADKRSFERLKPAERTITFADVPNWQEQLDVVKRKRTSVAVPGVEQDTFEKLASSFPLVAKDAEHDRIFADYDKTGYVRSYLADHNCYQMHTAGLAKVENRGFFATLSPGTDPATPNCFVFLKPNGVLHVVRYHSTVEHESWGSTANGPRSCHFNRPLDLQTAAQIVGATWTGDAATCHDVAQATALAKLLGFDLPPIPERTLNFKYCDANTIKVECDREKKETHKGWGLAYRKLACSFKINVSLTDELSFDSEARHLVNTEHADAGWLLHDDDDGWNYESKSTVKDRLQYKFDLSSNDGSKAIGQVAGQPYVIVNEPFAGDFLPGRKLNWYGAQLATAPTYGGVHPYHDLIFAHIGQGLDVAVLADPWCRQHAILSGQQYLMLWAASLFKRPKQHLPLLYLYSALRDNGKSALHKCLGLHLKRGYVEGIRALNEQFNKLLAGAVLCYLDEQEVDHKSAQKVKYYIDSDRCSIRMMRTDPYMLENFTHWVGAFNFPDSVPVEPGDERIVMIHVPTLPDEEKINWEHNLKPKLLAELSDFLGTLLSTELPPSPHRLYLPVLMTDLKRNVTGGQQFDREAFIQLLLKCKAFSGSTRELLTRLGIDDPKLRQHLAEVAADLKGYVIDLTNPRKIIIKPEQQ